MDKPTAQQEATRQPCDSRLLVGHRVTTRVRLSRLGNCINVRLLARPVGSLCMPLLNAVSWDFAASSVCSLTGRDRQASWALRTCLRVAGERRSHCMTCKPHTQLRHYALLLRELDCQNDLMTHLEHQVAPCGCMQDLLHDAAGAHPADAHGHEVFDSNAAHLSPAWLSDAQHTPRYNVHV